MLLLRLYKNKKLQKLFHQIKDEHSKQLQDKKKFVLENK